MIHSSLLLSSAVLVLVACDPGGTPRRTSDGGTFDGGAGFDAGPRVDVGPFRDAGPEACSPVPGADSDGDGYLSENDCNDCSAQVNAGAFDTPGNGVDEDCDGADATIDIVECDGALPIAGSAEDAARAIGLCRFVSESDVGWGVLSARFTTASGAGTPRGTEQTGILPSLGAVGPQVGGALLAISSGIARAPAQPGYTSDCDWFGLEPDFFTGEIPGDEPYPPGFPIDSPTCPGVRAGPVYNSVALEVRIRVPTNAFGFRFNSNFFTYEYPYYICDEYNDFYAVLRQEGSGPFENIVFDTMGDAVSVNNSLLQVCSPGFFGGKNFTCPLGRASLGGTGFDNTAICGNEDPDGFPATEQVGGSTGWLRTTAGVEGGSILTLRFAIWDSGDPVLDSLTVIDAFEWELEEIENTDPVTEPLI